MPYAILLAVPLALFVGKRQDAARRGLPRYAARTIFLAMAVTRNGGMAIHHQCCFGPPHRSYRAFARFPAGASIYSSINQYTSSGSTEWLGGFTDAVNPLAASLSGSAGDTVYLST